MLWLCLMCFETNLCYLQDFCLVMVLFFMRKPLFLVFKIEHRQHKEELPAVSFFICFFRRDSGFAHFFLCFYKNLFFVSLELRDHPLLSFLVHLVILINGIISVNKKNRGKHVSDMTRSSSYYIIHVLLHR